MDRLTTIARTAMRGTMARQAAVANNLANVNTTGFRAEIANASTRWVGGGALQSRAEQVGQVIAADMKSGTAVQTGNPLDLTVDGDALIAVQANDGSEAYTRRGDLRLSESGLLTPGSSPTDLAVSGDGFFVVSENTRGFTATDPVAFTRAGSFTPDANGYLKNSAGLYLAGWPVQADGTIDADPSDLNSLEIINPVSVGGAAEATTEVGLSANMQASQAVSASEATYDATGSATNMASGGVTADVQYGIPIYDSQGGVRTINLSMLKSATPNQWHAELHVSPASEVTTGAGLVDGQIATGIIAFDANGNFDAANSTIPSSLNFLASANVAALGGHQFPDHLTRAWRSVQRRRPDPVRQPERTRRDLGQRHALGRLLRR